MIPATTIQPNDELALRVRVVTLKPSEHKWYGPHDLITVEVVDPDGDLPEGLRFQLRRPHDGTADLRSDDRREQAARRGQPEPVAAPEPSPSMSKGELLALADARGVEVPHKATKDDLLALLAD